MQHVTTIAEYCQIINIPPPRLAHFDIRSFADNMLTVNQRQEPFRHEFYAVALRRHGSNQQVMGQPLAANIFFNTPYQLVSWDIKPDWQGWYILFDEELARSASSGGEVRAEFPFLTLDHGVPFDVPPADEAFLDSVFQQMHAEYHSAHPDRHDVLAAYTRVLLLYVRRHYNRLSVAQQPPRQHQSADEQLLLRFRALLERHIAEPAETERVRQASFYAEQLAVHPNHLNAASKRISGKTASQLVQEQLITVARHLLQNTGTSVKELAYRLHFSEPTHFIGFFKKHTGRTPQQFREPLAGVR